MSLYRAARGALRNPLDKHEEAQWPKEARAGRARGKRRSAKARRPKARSTKTSRWPSRNDTWTRAVRAGKMQLAVVRVIPRGLHTRKGKGSSRLFPAAGCRRLEGERTIAGAERTRQLRSMMLFLGFWNSLSHPSPFHPPLPHSTYHFVASVPHLSLVSRDSLGAD